MKLLCVDGNSILNRSFYGIRELSTKDGMPTNAIYGFFNILAKTISEVNPDGIVAAFDLKAPTFRHKQYSEYKANRKGMPEELFVQLEPTKELLRLLGYHVCEVEGFEADDILGAFAKTCRESGWECVIATGDRDSLQLVGEGVTVRLATTKETIVYDTEKIKEVYGVSPKQLIEVKALMGDSSDNIPGVSGCGEKTALALIKEFGSLEGVYENIDSSLIKPKMRENLLRDKDTAYLSRQLAEIVTQVPMDTNPEHYKFTGRDEKGAAEYFLKLEMVSSLKKFGLEETGAKEPVEDRPKPAVKKREVIKNPKLSDAHQMIDKQDRIDFLCMFDSGQLSRLLISCEDNILDYNFDCAGIFQSLICEQEKPKRTCDAKEIYRFCIQNNLDLKNLVMDTTLAGYLLDPNGSDYSITALAKKYMPDFDPESELFEINVLTPLADRLEKEIELKGMSGLLSDIELPFCQVLADMEETGFYVDRDGVNSFGEQLRKDIERLTEEIYQLAGESFNINSTKALASILFEKLGLPAKKKTKSGYSTDVTVLESLADKHEIIPKILEYRKLTKLNSTYVVGLLKAAGPDGRVHSVFRQTEARTGRISSTEPNMQNIPVRTPLGRQMRRFFAAKDGCLLVDADYSQIELRILAHIAGDEQMAEAFRKGLDIHAMTASKVFGVPLEVLPSELRSRAKTINFGIVYGIGAFSLSKDINVSVSEASRYIKEYLETYSGVRDYMNRTVEEGEKLGYVTTMFGRRRDLPELKSKNRAIREFGKRVAMNTPIQGTAADIIKLAMVKVYRRLKEEKLKAKIILQVHDEIILEAAEKDADRALEVLKEEMEGAVKLSVPLVADGKTAKNWYLAKE